MRLLQITNTDPELIYFANELEIPNYVILSHVWGDEEVTFQDIQDPLKRKDMKGWSKVVGACKQARSEDWEYIWIDTCCIDKSSSAELSEAINSMYRYYRKAEVCYAYLTDMQNDHLGRSFDLNFRMCRWFTRGWMLQELIAPPTVFFFTNEWMKIGTKASLQETITDITGIPSEVLLSQDGPSECSIAARMSWAAGRETTLLSVYSDRTLTAYISDVPRSYSVSKLCTFIVIFRYHVDICSSLLFGFHLFSLQDIFSV
ncbi:heterokaryon incompatibility protein-domain-containing protein [Rhodocollybia butyracea]|uniref:Heterokaryon incompatibility protein-domain-containing protein n=1 Tax=Rhodocollybia butyracea TaxID=206335 RepID=A0A9P5TZI0_9AGAR|nr:heterokaryon incompatibility protein-domain-containing protein [Rhodocollybia butyracea]